MKPEMIENLKSAIRDIPDFPKPGILFKDITTLVKDPVYFRASVDLLVEHAKNLNIDLIAAIESRGFIFGSAMAYAMGLGFIPIRKPGKLPGKTVRQRYELEYGFDEIEIHADAIRAGDKVLIIDDLLATGGTALAAAQLIRKLDGDVVEIAFLVELGFLNGRKLLKDYNMYSLVTY